MEPVSALGLLTKQVWAAVLELTSVPELASTLEPASWPVRASGKPLAGLTGASGLKPAS